MEADDMKLLLDARRSAAQIVVRYGVSFLPFFERLDQEVKKARESEAIMARALHITRESSEGAL